MALILRTCPSLVQLSSLILGVRHLNTKITAMWCQHDITVHLRLYWVIFLSILKILFGSILINHIYIYICMRCVKSAYIVFCRAWMELSLWFMECGLHPHWTLLGTFSRAVYAFFFFLNHTHTHNCFSSQFVQLTSYIEYNLLLQCWRKSPRK